MGSLQINLLGASFAIRASEESAYLEKLLGYYKRITQEVEKTGGLKNPTEVAIMSGIALVDELYKEKSKNAQQVNMQHTANDDDEAERLTLKMIEKIDKVLH
ncbi:MAG: cell division protein ZapA [Treponema sp.]|nr:cell division protein ZapA [Treponema sp.]